MEASVFDEDLVGVHTRYQHTCQVHPLAIAFQRYRIRVWPPGLRVEVNAMRG